MSETEKFPPIPVRDGGLVAWAIETLGVILLMGPLLVVVLGRSNDAGLFFDMFRGQLLTALFVLLSGYWFTTGVLSALSRSHRIWMWLYPGAATVLWAVHMQLYFFSSLGRHTHSSLTLLAIGASLVLFCTLVGTWSLWKWR